MVRAAILAAMSLSLGTCAWDAPTPACSGAPAAPIRTEALVDAIRAEGFSVRAEDGSELCAAEGTVASLTNDEGWEDEGLVICGVRNAPLREDEVEVRRDPGRDEIDVQLANVECTLYPQADAEDDQLARLERALRALEADLRS
jgi:hypothetical protein